MLYSLPSWVVVAGHFALLLIAFYTGFKLKGRSGLNADANMGGNLIISGTLLSLLLGFTFNNAADKAQKRKLIFSQETNAISSCFANAKLYPDSCYGDFKKQLLQYANFRVEYFNNSSNEDLIAASLDQSDSVAAIISDQMAAYSRNDKNILATQQMVPAVNAMLAARDERETFRTARVPVAALKMMLLLSLIISFVNGAASREPKTYWYGALAFALLIGMTLFLIFDLDTPAQGLITLDSEQAKLIKLLNSIK
jgi:hypothetical protein